MIETISEFFKNLTGGNEFLMLYLMSVMPVIELRGAVVFMSGMFTDSPQRFADMYAGMWCCIAGSTSVILPLLFTIKPLINRLKRTKLFSRLAEKIEANLADRAESACHGKKADGARQTYSENQQSSAQKGAKKKKLSKDTKKFWGLFAFVAVPLPMTGAWTGSCVGSFLNLKLWKAALAVFIGNIVAGHILLAIAYFIPQQYADWFMYGFIALAIGTAVMLFFTKIRREERQKTAMSGADTV